MTKEDWFFPARTPGSRVSFHSNRGAYIILNTSQCIAWRNWCSSGLCAGLKGSVLLVCSDDVGASIRNGAEWSLGWVLL